MHRIAVTMLASGSKGNAALLQAGPSFFLIDLGLTCRELGRRLAQLGLAIQQLEAVFITHEHSDHIKGLATLLKNYSVPVYASEAAWQGIRNRFSIYPAPNCLSLPERLTLKGVEVAAFPVPHDAPQTRGLRFSYQGEACVYISDAGHVTPAMREAAEGATVLVIEANHDVALLKQGSYPADLKRRILGRQGHLANREAAELVAGLRQPPATVILCHLSEENNRPALARKALEDALRQQGRTSLPTILVASQNRIVGPSLAEQTAIFPASEGGPPNLE